MYKTIGGLLLAIISITSCHNGPSKEYSENNFQETGENWPQYGGNTAGNRYSPLTQINKGNVQHLQAAWSYDARDIRSDGSKSHQAIQCQPVVVGGVLYGTTPELRLFALDATSGTEIWKFDPQNDNLNVSRGITYWEKGDDKRILYTVGDRLYAVNAITGLAITSFGVNGSVDLHEGLSTPNAGSVGELSVKATSPGVLFEDFFIIGSSVSESGTAAPGHIRAFNVVTGKLEWVFHTIPQPGELGHETWPKDAYKKIGGANNWAGMVVDSEEGVVFFGTGSPASDFYGGERPGKNLFGNCIVALHAKTGKLKWYYQTIYHDLWDRDLPIPPNLAYVTQNGQKLKVVVQATKEGYVYVLNAETGESMFPVEERSVPMEGLPGEQLWPVQRYPLKPAPFSRQVFTEEDISDISPTAYEYTKETYEKYKADHRFTPPSEEGTLMFGYSGGAEWGGNAVDQDGILYQNSNDNPWVLRMIDQEARNRELSSLSRGNALYAKQCAACHGTDRAGNGSDFPDLRGIGQQMSSEQLREILRTGSGRMPSFGHLTGEEREAIASFLFNPRSGGRNKAANKNEEDNPTFGYEPAYAIREWRKLTDPDGYPGVKPPWGTLNAIDLNTGEYVWRKTLGEFPELTKKGIPVTGTESYGGPIVTAGGLVFIAGTRDEKIRAFDKDTGEVLWEYQLPAGGFATPITYEVEGRQYIAIAAGGGRGLKAGGNYIAFSLKDDTAK
ncbi:PQQ-binding-like beta-propeller repeat protein [Muricauda sp. CAU 1633]|uniref:outer membrane protein assembly factor BamB family protein n=1 Tax=Allomuricauda sp. CAU 1633 TaxID=2816036 RepID=UPI001A8D629F|nr:PQQ-binding-like beta-propeller repeat protein [Muricauda sp. CAU 1633]MBO0323642.1 PQQ-binding-like beta-propeller repeat protein [Muricauda sp. CAU 1633]